ncbi:hypothetical protein SESBI_37756 [Sesbania bispinosa]|nr:hypothetical protein SESBI_37756 [Sesbania bispinosa]
MGRPSVMRFEKTWAEDNDCEKIVFEGVVKRRSRDSIQTILVASNARQVGVQKIWEYPQKDPSKSEKARKFIETVP